MHHAKNVFLFLWEIMVESAVLIDSCKKYPGKHHWKYVLLSSLGTSFLPRAFFSTTTMQTPLDIHLDVGRVKPSDLAERACYGSHQLGSFSWEILGNGPFPLWSLLYGPYFPPWLASSLLTLWKSLKKWLVIKPDIPGDWWNIKMALV